MNEHDLVNEIRSKVDIVDVISSYLPLTQKGKNFFGVCPFHDDTNPSMSVSRELQIYRCFSCGASGNVFSFVMDYEHISFRESLNLLAKRAGVEIKGLQLTDVKSKLEPFYFIYETAHKFYQNNLNSKQGSKAREYLKNRMITDDMIKEFGIGLSLDQGNQLVRLLKAKNYDILTLNKIGLATEDHDTYINRIMFPLSDLTGKVVGFSGRIYEDSKQSKYVNTKETPIFKKGQLLYHYSVAKEEVRIKKQVIVMEGFMDVIRVSTAGLRNTVALMGTAMTEEQAKLVKRLSNDIILCFDGDEAGQHATLVNGEHLLNLGANVKVIELTDDLDPDTFILKYGTDKYVRLVESAIPFTDYKIKVLRKGVNFQSDEETSQYIHGVLREASHMQDEIRVEIILKSLAKEFNIEYNTLEKRLTRIKQEEHVPDQIKLPPKEEKEKKRKDKYEMSTLSILYYMLKSDKVIRKYEREGVFFPNDRARFLASEISYYYKKYGKIEPADFYTYLKDKKELSDLLTEVLALELGDLSDDAVEDFFQVVKEYNVNQEIKRLQKKIREEMDEIEASRIAEKIRKLRMGVE